MCSIISKKGHGTYRLAHEMHIQRANTLSRKFQKYDPCTTSCGIDFSVPLPFTPVAVKPLSWSDVDSDIIMVSD